jgi:hypothetical protein
LSSDAKSFDPAPLRGRLFALLLSISTPFMSIKSSGLAKRVLRLEAELEYYKDKLRGQIGDPTEEEIMEILQDKYPNLEAPSVNDIDFRKVDVT